MDKIPRVVELTDLPRCDSAVSYASVLHGWSRAYVGYETNDDAASIALVRLDECRYLVTGGPNDEAFHNHRFAAFGLEHYRIQEFVDSPWIPEVLTLLHKERKYTGPNGYRHFIFGMKECTVDCIAKTISCIGLYPDHRAAMAAALAELD